jgi:hypothetical protein
MQLVRDDDEALLREPVMPLRIRVVVVLEIVVLYAWIRWLVWRSDLPRVVARLRGGRADRHPADRARRLGQRLASPVRRTLDPLPWDSRCLMRSLVLLSMLARRGVTSQLVIGVRPGDEFTAHAWVEYGGRPLMPTLGYDRLTTI